MNHMTLQEEIKSLRWEIEEGRKERKALLREYRTDMRKLWELENLVKIREEKYLNHD